jgi:hypothetical protein
MASTPQSRKAKGRNLQKLAVQAFLELGKPRGLEDDDVLSRSMGANGVDIIFSPQARRLFGPLAVECKNHEVLNVVSIFWQHAEKYKEPWIPLLVHKKNRTEPLVTLRLSDYTKLLQRSIEVETQST